MRRALLTAAAFGVAASGAAAAVWRVTEAFRHQALLPDPGPKALPLSVAAVEGEAVTFEAPSHPENAPWFQPGLWGLEWPRGYAQLDSLLDRRGHHVEWQYRPLEGAPRPGDRARFDNFFFPGDPQAALGIAFEEQVVPGPLGPMPAWSVPADPDRWVVFVHGKGASRREALRDLPTVHAAGWSGLVITYRNDPEAPPDPSGHYHYGVAEWPDLEAAVSMLVARGAREVVVCGYSMGGAIAVAFMLNGRRTRRVRGLVLQAPMLGFGATIATHARRRGTPRLLVEAGKLAARWRFGIEWPRTDYLARADELDVPILLFHGADDPEVPVALSDRLAAMRPERVTYVRVPGAGHVRTWNVDRERHEAALRRFLQQLDTPSG